MRTSIIKRRSILCLLLVFIMAFVFAAVSCMDDGDSGSSDISQSESTSETTSESDSDVADKGSISVKDKTKTLYVGETYKIEATSEDTFAYESTDENVATVTTDGVVTALSDGIAFIKVSDGKTFVNVKISVIKSEEYIRLGATEIGFVKGGERTVNAEVIKNGEVSDDEITFSCDDAAIKLVKNGKSVTISSDKTGNYVVVASCGNLRAEIAVKVVSDSSKMLDSTKSSVENCATLKWGAVENASGYQVAVNGGEWVDVDGTTFDVHAYTDGLKYGETVVFAVRAVAKNNFDFFDSLPERAAFSHNYKETVIEAYTCVTAGKVKYACADCGKEYEQDGVLAPHSIKNGACEVCGKIITEKILYVYDEANECYYVGGTDAGFDSEEVYILAEYNDGKNGNHPVKYFGVNAFKDNEIIKKVVIPASITEFKDKRGAYNNINKNGEMLSSPLRGGTFDACVNLEFVSMEGITYLPAIDSVVICDENGNFVRLGTTENMTAEEIAKGYTAEKTEYYHDTFRDCYKLAVLIVGDGFDNDGRTFMNWLSTPSGVSGTVDIYVNGKIKKLASDSYPIGSPSGANNNLLSGDVFYYEQDSAKCFTWYYDDNGNFVSNGKHDYNRSGVCRKCYALNDYGIKYEYDEARDVYCVGNNANTTESEIAILSEYDDGEHGMKPVTYIKNSAFMNNRILKRIILPESIVRLDGSVFQSCSNLEYVSMTGINAMAFKNVSNEPLYVGQGEIVTNNNFLNCFALKAVVVGKNFNIYADSDEAQQFIGVGDGIISCVDIFVNAKKSESDVNCAPSAKNNILTGRVYYEGDLKRCGEWKYDDEENIVTSARAEHNYKNGICENCGDYQTYGVNYLFDAAKNVYYIASYTGSNPEMKVLGEYDDGEHGVKPVGYVKNSAFMDNRVITKVVLPASVKRIEGSVFQGCSNLEYISMVGVEELTLENLSNKGIYGDDVFSTNNFLNCGKLKVVIVGKKFKITNNHFIRTDDDISKGLADIYMSGTKAECQFICNLTDRNEHLSGVVYYLGDLSRCQEWKFNADGSISTSAKSHNYVNDKCVNCGEYQTHGVTYLYNEAKDVYYVSGYIGTEPELKILSTYNDGTHGEKAVTYVAELAFADNTIITKVILPDSVRSLDGGVFQGCVNLEYVSMAGVENLDYNGSASGYGTDRGNNFMNCTALKYVILNADFTTNCQQFFMNGGNPEKAILDIYVNAANGAPSFAEGTNQNLLTGNVYHKGDASKCFEWNFDVNGNIVHGANAHNFVDGKCENCGAYNTMGVVYNYNEAKDCYYVDDNKTLNLSEFTILGMYNDGTHGEKAVKYLNAEAFAGNATITKVILPASVTEFKGGVFLNCYNLKYISMTGVETLNDWNANNNFLNCINLETVIVGKMFEVQAQQFKLHGETAVTNPNIYVDGAKSESSISIEYGGDINNLLSGDVYYKGDASKCFEWNFDVNGNIVHGANAHNFVDGKCENCGVYNTMGVVYNYNEAKDCYYVGDNKTLNVAEITILSTYNDGTHGEKAVTYIAELAFMDNTIITKVILSDSVRSLDGGVFQGCVNLEYVSMTGVENLDYNGSASGYGTDRGNNFMNCTALKYIVLNPNFTTNCQQFFLNGSNPEKAILDIYVNAANGVPSFAEGTNQNLLTGNIYHKGDASKCFEWNFDVNGNIVHGANAHNFVDGKCTICGTYNAAGVVYGYDEVSKSYYVAGCESSLTEVIVLDKFDDGEHGEAAVTFVKFGAFMNNAVIKKVKLGKNITTLDGCVFLDCLNLEYVSMEGIEELKKTTLGESDRGSVYDFNDFTWRNFEGCTKLTAIVVGKRFTVGAKMFHGDAMGTVKIYTTAANTEEFTLTIDRSDANNNNNLLSDSVYYFSETELGGAWHYVNGAPTLWA